LHRSLRSVFLGAARRSNGSSLPPGTTILPSEFRYSTAICTVLVMTAGDHCAEKLCAAGDLLESLIA
jgi:hypothetical protein